ncbi:MAG: hypothetical protein Q9159_000608 [Coniocarpon cinnabarinum]
MSQHLIPSCPSLDAALALAASLTSILIHLLSARCRRHPLDKGRSTAIPLLRILYGPGAQMRYSDAINMSMRRYFLVLGMTSASKYELRNFSSVIALASTRAVGLGPAPLGINTCEYRPPAPAQRKKRKAQREALEQMVKKLREYEGYLHSQGLPIQPFDTSRIEDLLHPSQLRTESLNLSSTEERGLVATSNDDVLQSQPRLDIAGSNLLQTQTSVESFQHAHTTALLTKVGIESAKTLHLHQNESQLGLSAFEAEMRRRLWWYFLALDARAAERNGCPELSTVPSADCILPLNVDDQVLTPGMQQLPSSTTKAADMTYCYLRYVMLKMESQQRTSLQARHRDTNPSLGQLNADFERIAKLETRLNDQFLSVDSPGAPFHDIAVATTHMTLCRMRIQAILLQTVGNWAGDASPHSITVLKELFKQHLRVIGYDSSIYNIPRSSGLQWHLRQHFPWRSLLHVLEVLCNHDLSIVDDLVDTWQELDKMHASHPEMINDLLTPVPRLQKDGAEMMLQAWTNSSPLEKAPNVEGLWTDTMTAQKSEPSLVSSRIVWAARVSAGARGKGLGLVLCCGKFHAPNFEVAEVVLIARSRLREAAATKEPDLVQQDA